MMDITNETMFYGGIVLTVISILGMSLYLLVARLKKMKLDIQLDQEYGKTEKNDLCQK